MTETAFHIQGAERSACWLVTCDHATNHVPDWINGGDLGLPPADMARHIAYDPGALGVSEALARLLDAPLISTNFSRLVIDPNRGETDPTLLMKLYDGTIIPANRHADAAEKLRRLERLHRPYHKALETLAARRENSVICAIHSFTPQLRGRPPRPWQVGILSDPRDRRLAEPLIEALRARHIPTGDNEPYKGHLAGDSIDCHALQTGRLNILIELRQDLIQTRAQQEEWAATLAPLLQQSLDCCQNQR
ncbi:N-formylglutamate amidohydrolase [Thioclava litoralis]|uniref:N-formylglutamate amidohydrolase n=1 Tax=Thioclava litoralis TaxID=3076557 RepID=A0ABZ1E3P8_9RHOB|nr:N-formylglutamate amidohydrolase [Thioclava sp. FTW29]